MSLNEIKNDMEGVIAPTDSRYRSDIRQLELGDLGTLDILIIFEDEIQDFI
jgi:hypothetical protein